ASKPRDATDRAWPAEVLPPDLLGKCLRPPSDPLRRAAGGGVRQSKPRQNGLVPLRWGAIVHAVDQRRLASGRRFALPSPDRACCGPLTTGAPTSATRLGHATLVTVCAPAAPTRQPRPTAWSTRTRWQSLALNSRSSPDRLLERRLRPRLEFADAAFV